MPDTSGMGAIYKKKYCLGDSSQCARFQVFKRLGKGSVPANLYPNMIARVPEIVAAHERV